MRIRRSSLAGLDGVGRRRRRRLPAAARAVARAGRCAEPFAVGGDLRDPVEPSRVPPERLTDLVAYDRRRPLDVTTRRTTSQPKAGVVVTDLTFDGGFGQPVEAYLVAPLRPPGRTLAGVVFAHGAGRDRSRFLEEAKVLARRGALALLPTVPMNMSGNAGDDITAIGRAVIAQRRALDVLAARPEVDRRRLGFVGHSWGAVLGSVLAGADQRLAAVVIASFTKPVSKYFGSTKQYRDEIAVFDQHRWLAMRGGRTGAAAGRSPGRLASGRRDRRVVHRDRGRQAATGL